MSSNTDLTFAERCGRASFFSLNCFNSLELGRWRSGIPLPHISWLQHGIGLLVLTSLLSSCNGDSKTPTPSTAPVQSAWIEGDFNSSDIYKSFCEEPRSGTSPVTGIDYPDMLGSTLDENNWLRSWTNDTYLWYDEVIDRDPALYETSVYFDLLKTNETTASGEEKDPFHFTQPSDQYQQQSQVGVSAGYGFEFTFLSRNPYEIAIVYTQPDSPAADADIRRGARIISIDGVGTASPSSQAEVDVLNAGLFPESLGESHLFEIQDLGAETTRVANLTNQNITSVPVQNVKTLDTDSGMVGYLTFNEHIATAEALLIDAVTFLLEEDISDLILDLRYNSGGSSRIASQLAYMIAGDENINGRFFNQLRFNDQHPVFNPVTDERNDPYPFVDFVINAPEASPGDPLPSLNLDRVFVLSTERTCSASELIINSLRGIEVEVILIGDTTCGKPYGFYPQDNCGTTYFSVQIQAENALGFGDYRNGFSPSQSNSSNAVLIPGCVANDDFDSLLGDPEEAILATALTYIASGMCPVPDPSSSSATTPISQKAALKPGGTLKEPSKPFWLQNSIMENADE